MCVYASERTLGPILTMPCCCYLDTHELVNLPSHPHTSLWGPMKVARKLVFHLHTKRVTAHSHARTWCGVFFIFYFFNVAINVIVWVICAEWKLTGHNATGDSWAICQRGWGWGADGKPAVKNYPVRLTCSESSISEQNTVANSYVLNFCFYLDIIKLHGI